MSLTYIVLNLLLQNEWESEEMESDSCDEFTRFLLKMDILKILIVVTLRNQEYDEEIRMKPCQ